MNVTCATCATVFRVDPAKIPERGVRARCSVCGGLIAVRRPETAPSPPAVPTEPTPAATVPPPSPPPAAEAAPAPAETVSAPSAPPPAPAPPLVTPAVPLGALPTEERPPEPEDEPETPEATSTPPEPQGATGAAPGRFSNPFLQQDPSTRARRLARALVSDLVVYHPEKRQRGLADGNLKELFGEEIRKSWEEYLEQVGEELAKTTPYFTEALNEILAEGQSLFG